MITLSYSLCPAIQCAQAVVRNVCCFVVQTREHYLLLSLCTLVATQGLRITLPVYVLCLLCMRPVLLSLIYGSRITVNCIPYYSLDMPRVTYVCVPYYFVGTVGIVYYFSLPVMYVSACIRFSLL